MVDLVWTVFCKRAIEDRRSGNLSLIETIQRFTVQVKPGLTETSIGVPVDSIIATLWANSDSDETATADVSVSTTPPDGKITENATFQLKIAPNGWARWYINVQTMQLRGPGRYQFIFKVKQSGQKRWKKVATIPLDVVYNEDESHPEFTRTA